MMPDIFTDELQRAGITDKSVIARLREDRASD